MNNKFTRLLFLLALAYNQSAAIGLQKKSCSSFFTISTALGDCSVIVTTSIENGKIKSYDFEVEADINVLQDECIASAAFLRKYIQGSSPESILNLSEQLLLQNRQHSEPLLDTDPELHKVIPLRALKNGLLTYLRQEN